MGGQFKKLKWSLDDLDLTKPIEPLSRFIDEPEKLIDEVFKIAAQYLHKDIVPSSLKDIPTVELKKLCLEQLKKVERKTLLNILTDESNELAADQSGSNLNETKEPESIASGSGLSKVEIQGKINSQVINTNEEKDKNDQSKKKKNKRSKQESSSPGDEVKPEEKSEVSNPVESSNLDSILDQAAIEIRELEIRAQAIRELLKKHEDADNKPDQTNAENQKESRKRPRINSTTHDESTNVQKDKSSNDKSKVVPINMPSQKAMEQRSKEVPLKTPATSRLSRNPVSMVEEDESDNLPTSSTSDTNSKRTRKRTSDESNMMIQLNNDSDDSIDRELKGE